MTDPLVEPAASLAVVLALAAYARPPPAARRWSGSDHLVATG